MSVLNNSCWLYSEMFNTSIGVYTAMQMQRNIRDQLQILSCLSCLYLINHWILNHETFPTNQSKLANYIFRGPSHSVLTCHFHVSVWRSQLNKVGSFRLMRAKTRVKMCLTSISVSVNHLNCPPFSSWKHGIDMMFVTQMSNSRRARWFPGEPGGNLLIVLKLLINLLEGCTVAQGHWSSGNQLVHIMESPGKKAPKLHLCHISNNKKKTIQICHKFNVFMLR